MGPDEMVRVADLIDRALTGSDDDRRAVRREVNDLVTAFPIYDEAGPVPPLDQD
jgi:glycine/serine hydroxymethyltransferase